MRRDHQKNSYEQKKFYEFVDDERRVYEFVDDERLCYEFVGASLNLYSKHWRKSI